MTPAQTPSSPSQQAPASPKVVAVPGLGNVQFPGEMPDEQIASVLKQQAPAPPAAPQAQEPAPGVLSQAGNFAKGVVSGIGGAAMGTVSGLSGLVGGPTLSPELTEPRPGHPGEGTGNAIENVLEFIGGSELFKGLGAAAKYEELARASKLLKNSPIITKILGSVIENATVGGAQGTAKAGTIEGGVKEAVPAAVLGGISGGAGAIRAERAAKLAADLPKQELASGAEGEIAKTATEAGTQAAKKVVPGVKTVKGITNFEDAAKAAEGAAKPVFKTLDEVSDNQFTAIRNQIKRAQKVMLNPSSIEAGDAAETNLNEAETMLKNLFEEHADKVTPEQLAAAKSAWRSAKVLDGLHEAVEGAFSAPKEVAQRTAGSQIPVPRTLNGTKLANGLNRMVKNNSDFADIVGKDGVDKLYQIAEATKDSAKATKLNGMLGAVGNVLGIPHAAVLVKIAEHPTMGDWLLRAVELGTDPKVAAPLIAREVLK